jgi:hypothetical protein
MNEFTPVIAIRGMSRAFWHISAFPSVVKVVGSSGYWRSEKAAACRHGYHFLPRTVSDVFNWLNFC